MADKECKAKNPLECPPEITAGKSFDNITEYLKSLTPEQKSEYEKSVAMAKSKSDRSALPLIPLDGGGVDTGLNITPSKDHISAEARIQQENYKLELELRTAINGETDNRVKARLYMLLGMAMYGAYIGFEKGSNMQMFSLAGAMRKKGGTIKISGAFLKKIINMNSSEVGKTFSPEMSQRSFGIDYSKYFNEGTLRELKTSIVYSQTDNKELGVIGNIVNDDSYKTEWFDVIGGVAGGSKTSATGELGLRVTDNVRVNVSGGVERLQYNSMLGSPGSTVTGGTGKVGLTYQPDSHNRISGALGHSKSGNTASMTAGHIFDNGVEGFVEASHTQGVGGLSNENKVFAGFKIPLEKTHSGYGPLFQDNTPGSQLNFHDLNPNSDVTSEQLAVARGVSQTVKTKEQLKNQPGTIAIPTLSSKTSSSISVIPGATAGMTNVRVAIYSDAGLTNKIAENTTGSFTGLTANAIYYIVTVGDDLNEATGLIEVKKSSTLSVTTETPSDTTPDVFNITDLTNQTRNTSITTNEITVSGINQPVSATTTLGTIVKNGVDIRSDTTQVVAGDKVSIKLTTSSNYSATQNGTLTIGDYRDSFNVTTEAMTDTLPVAINFPESSTTYNYNSDNDVRSMSVNMSGISGSNLIFTFTPPPTQIHNVNFDNSTKTLTFSLDPGLSATATLNYTIMNTAGSSNGTVTFNTNIR
ncbi:MAG: hypothetical protein PHE25_05975 [Candidatus Gracilibacteria bacterium]|nr:hypothetical protein [Candidatus Gracilibacteria bacterium]